MMTPVGMYCVIVLPAKSWSVIGMSEPLWIRPVSPLWTATLGLAIVSPTSMDSK